MSTTVYVRAEACVFCTSERSAESKGSSFARAFTPPRCALVLSERRQRPWLNGSGYQSIYAIVRLDVLFDTMLNSAGGNVSFTIDSITVFDS